MIRVINWSSFQSYKDRKPPWIRLHKTLLDNYEFQSMSANSRALLPMIWLLASEHEDPTSGVIESDERKISFRLRLPEKDIKSGILEMIKNGFIEEIQLCNETVTDSLRNGVQSVTSETETEAYTKETEAEKDSSEDSDHSPGKYSPRQGKIIFQHWQKVMGHEQAVFGEKRKKAVKRIIDEGYTVSQVLTAIDGCKASPFHMGDNKGGTIYDELGLICRDAAQIDKFMALASKPNLVGLSAAGRKTAANMADWTPLGEVCNAAE